jgi:hypothetical protein
MSKIDDFNKAVRVFNRVRDNIYLSTGRDRKGRSDLNNDKAILRIYYHETHSSDWNEAKLLLHASHGFYGSSSGYSDMDIDTAKYMVKALNNHIENIAEEAIKLAEIDMEKARQEAISEANRVLKDIAF